MFGNRMLVPGGFSDLINQNNYNANWKKLLGFRNIQEKLEKLLDDGMISTSMQQRITVS